MTLPEDHSALVTLEAIAEIASLLRAAVEKKVPFEITSEVIPSDVVQGCGRRRITINIG